MKSVCSPRILVATLKRNSPTYFHNEHNAEVFLILYKLCDNVLATWGVGVSLRLGAFTALGVTLHLGVFRLSV